MSVLVHEIIKKYKNTISLDKVSFEINSGEMVALVGPSGSGKTTILKVIAGLINYEEGKLFLHGQDSSNLSLKERNIGLVFQNYALFNHMTVFDNVAFGMNIMPKASRPSKKRIEHKTLDLLNLVQMENFAKRYPRELSGGQQQRVALARTLATNPKILLLDEPFGALDPQVRKDIRSWLKQLHTKLQLTTIIVTHDQEEAIEIADKIILLNNGQIEQIGPPSEIYHNPSNGFVYEFFAETNKFSGWLKNEGDILISDYNHNQDSIYGNLTQTKWYEKIIGKKPNFDVIEKNKNYFGREIDVFSRPQDIKLFEKDDKQPCFKAKAIDINICGPMVKIMLEVEDKLKFQSFCTHEEFAKLHLTKGNYIFARVNKLKYYG